MANAKWNIPDYQQGYKAGYTKGYKTGRKERKEQKVCFKNAYWIVRKGDWYCSNCDTKHEQAHDNFCCKCGCKMSEEAIL